MKNLLPALAFIAVLATVIIFSNRDRNLNNPGRLTAHLPKGPSLSETENETDELDKAIEQEVMLTMDPRLKRVPTERLAAAARFRDEQFNRQAARMSMGQLAAVPGINWQERGPDNIGGRTRGLIYDLNGSPGYTKVWAGGVGGGLWYTNDITAASPVWTKVNDLFANIAVTTIAQDPSTPNNIYFGTGEGWFNGDAIAGPGIWKSTDGGLSWNQLASTNNSNYYYIEKVLVTSAGTVLAATRNTGLMRSTDGGNTWTKVLGAGLGIAGNTSNRAADIERGANGYLYCSMGIFNSDGVFRSTDDGLTWTEIFSAGATQQRIEIACAPSNQDSIYILLQSSSTGGIESIKYTANATAVPGLIVWNTVANPVWCDQGSGSTDFTRTQAWYDLTAVVSPTNAASLIIGGVDMLGTSNSGASFTQISQWATGCGTLPNVHADIHNIVYKPGSSSEFLVACDGGIYLTANGGASFSSRNNSYNVTQYYSCAMHPTSSNYFLAGAQDNGTHILNAPGIGSGNFATGGDGGFCHIDQEDPQIQFTSYTGNYINLSLNGGSSFNFVALGGGSFINPSDYDDREKVFYSGAGSANLFTRWNSPNQPNGPYQAVSVAAFGGTVTHVSISPLTPNRVYFGINNGRVVRVDNANQGSSRSGTVIFTHPDGGVISCVAIDPLNEDHMLVTSSSYGVRSVFESMNATSGSPTFSNVEGLLPDMPVRWAMFDPRNSDWAFIATELGVWTTDDINAGGTTDWQPTNSGFANVRVDMFQYRPSDGTILAASHGRGLFSAVVPISKSIMFSNAGTADTESSAGGTVDCRAYKEYDIPMLVTAAPVGAATVTLSVSPSSTATEGIDFDYTTNGDFIAPSHSMNFPSGSTAGQSFKLRVYDDDEVENEETIVFGFSVSGATDAVQSHYNSTYLFTISNNDSNPYGSSTSNFAIGAGSSLSYLIGVNSGGGETNNRGRVQFMYLASELQHAGLKPGPINALTFTVAQKNSATAFQGFTVSMANTATANLNAGYVTSGLSQVFNGNLTTIAGINTINFSSAFNWDGVSNLVLQFCYDNGGTAVRTDYVQSTSLLDNNYYMIGRAQTNPGAGCSLGAQFVYTDRLDVVFTSTNDPTTIESTLNDNRIATIRLGLNYNLYSSADTQLLVSIINPDMDLGCVTARIDEAGTVWQSFAGGQRSQKVYEVTPTTGSAASYSITLYYTNAELAGKTASSLRILKTSAASASAATAANSVLVTPTVTDYGTYSSFSASFTGFSRFFLVDNNVVLPFILKDFRGKLNADAHSLLSWTTSTENNSSRFVVERSVDGIHYEDIGSVPAAGYSTAERKYSLTDPFPAEATNYYKLRMIDLDGIFRYSQVVIVRNPARMQANVRVLNNPFSDYIDLLFTTIPAQQTRISLYDIDGRVHYRKEAVSISQNRWRLDLSQLHLSKGNYVLEIISGGQRYSYSLIRQ